MNGVAETLTGEELEQYNRAKVLNDSIIMYREEEVSAKTAQLTAMWTMYEGELWKNLGRKYNTIKDWLGELEQEGVKYAAYSTFMDKMRSIQGWLASGTTLDNAIRLSAERDGVIKRLEKAGVIEIERTGGEISVNVTDKGREFLNDKPLSDYADDLLQQTPEQTYRTIKEDLGDTGVVVRTLNRVVGALPMDVSKAKILWGQASLIDGLGETPYQFAVFSEQEMPDAVLKELGKKLKRSYQGE